MALNMLTDETFDGALEGLARSRGESKSAVIRDLVLKEAERKDVLPTFGVLRKLVKDKLTAKQIVAELKAYDDDDRWRQLSCRVASR
jgi:hypothetical protein